MQDAGLPGRVAEVVVGLGCTVRCRDEDGEYTYTMVCPGDADVMRGLLSVTSPVGRALLGHCAGEEVMAQTPSGARFLTILSVDEGDDLLGGSWGRRPDRTTRQSPREDGG
jgi:transcription elongation GreA/GreB family factor